MQWEHVTIRAQTTPLAESSSSMSTSTAPRSTGIPCTAAVIRGGPNTGKELHDVLATSIAQGAQTIHVSLAAPLVSLAPTADWAWNVVQLPESTRLRLYGRPPPPPPPPATSSTDSQGQAVKLAPNANMPAKFDKPAVNSSTQTSIGALGETGMLPMTPNSHCRTAEFPEATTVFDLAGILQVLYVDSVLSLLERRIVLHCLILLNLPYLETPVHYHGFSQAMMNWVASHRWASACISAVLCMSASLATAWRGSTVARLGLVHAPLRMTKISLYRHEHQCRQLSTTNLKEGKQGASS